MFEIEIYEDEHGKSELKDFLRELRNKTEKDKDARVKFSKIVAYIDLLEEKGTMIGLPVMRQINSEIWELRPISIRVLFSWIGQDKYLLLHAFKKATRRTPAREIKKAERELADYKRRKKLQ
ncbi:MAG: type II toxin-antitoxin system RelE/ParE family toxin [Spirochaetales bacterium]|nr:type II toxin-antitoxin system RelE/ParE family toxin [Spirochaetales bacterium]